ncbi:MAG: F0F1 ATP synthase subunit epsilon [Candidatus Accumulibacter sp.]|uniref:FoF1 ATP synthase subunit delta/epsilon n=1 Tax=Accumulibacter sp. TaxID=2053492 RepID=UPI0019FF3CE5|nr:F0F1 ATP synthase subunit epsilon [Accumulibacter sp.]MBE2259826.1 F0F1 ATP synthase subunit epsilon [Paracoccaceae bacterium]MCB1942014.1 F0F1 ATP synthase subunit epsilon [Accumulibacter sp.]MCP5249107.1 F0F1 ATP synthase subunit epsilon [Accumulibacter sp.]
MNGFALHLHDSHGSDHFDDVVQFIAADGSGSFGVLAGHARMVAVLRYGLARFVDGHGHWRYLALPGGVLNCTGGRVSLATVRYFLGDERATICRQLADEMARTDSDVHTSRTTLTEIEHALLRRLGDLSGRVRQELGR